MGKIEELEDRIGSLEDNFILAFVIIVALIFIIAGIGVYHAWFFNNTMTDNQAWQSPCDLGLMEWEVKNYRQYIDCWNVECPQNMATSMDDTGKCFCVIKEKSCPSDIKILVVQP